MTPISVITLAKGRPDHLLNLIHGLTCQTMPPDELIVAVMQDALYALPETPFPIRQIQVFAEELPLAAARNAAARTARGETLIFLDMDCIPTPELVADYSRFVAEFDGLLMGEVMYLPKGATAGAWTYDALASVAAQHSDRGGPPPRGIEICSDYRCFWSLSFAMRRATFVTAGGFDERYVGYGGEDTDFGKTLDHAGIGIAWIKGGLAYHQHHSHHMPPVHHLDSVVRNAQLFEQKWGYRTMGHWLHAFRLMGLVDDTPGRPVRILRRPDDRDFELTGQQSHEPYATTARVIRTFEPDPPEISDSTAVAA